MQRLLLTVKSTPRDEVRCDLQFESRTSLWLERPTGFEPATSRFYSPVALPTELGARAHHERAPRGTRAAGVGEGGVEPPSLKSSRSRASSQLDHSPVLVSHGRRGAGMCNGSHSPLNMGVTPRSAQKRQRGDVLPQVLLSSRSEADGHQRTTIGRVGLVDLHVPHASQREPTRKLLELELVFGGQDDHVGSRRQISGTRLPRGVGDLCGLDASRQVRTDDDVVVEDALAEIRVATCPRG